MKKYKVAFLAFSLILLSACGTQEELSVAPLEKLIAKNLKIGDPESKIVQFLDRNEFFYTFDIYRSRYDGVYLKSLNTNSNKSIKTNSDGSYSIILIRIYVNTDGSFKRANVEKSTDFLYGKPAGAEDPMRRTADSTPQYRRLTDDEIRMYRNYETRLEYDPPVLDKYRPVPAREPSFTGEYCKASMADTLPSPIEPQAMPVYPRELKRQGVTGSALVTFMVTTDGKTDQVQIIQASHRVFGEAAVEAVKQWRFTPAVKDGKPVNCLLDLPVTFNLEEDQPEQTETNQ